VCVLKGVAGVGAGGTWAVVVPVDGQSNFVKTSSAQVDAQAGIPLEGAKSCEATWAARNKNVQTKEKSILDWKKKQIALALRGGRKEWWRRGNVIFNFCPFSRVVGRSRKINSGPERGRWVSYSGSHFIICMYVCQIGLILSAFSLIFHPLNFDVHARLDRCTCRWLSRREHWTISLADEINSNFIWGWRRMRSRQCCLNKIPLLAGRRRPALALGETFLMRRDWLHCFNKMLLVSGKRNAPGAWTRRLV